MQYQCKISKSAIETPKYILKLKSKSVARNSLIQNTKFWAAHPAVSPIFGVIICRMLMFAQHIKDGSCWLQERASTSWAERLLFGRICSQSSGRSDVWKTSSAEGFTDQSEVRLIIVIIIIIIGSNDTAPYTLIYRVPCVGSLSTWAPNVLHLQMQIVSNCVKLRTGRFSGGYWLCIEC